MRLSHYLAVPVKRTDKTAMYYLKFQKTNPLAMLWSYPVWFIAVTTETGRLQTREGWVSDCADKTLKLAEFNCIKSILAVQRSPIHFDEGLIQSLNISAHMYREHTK